ncbi:GvpL/GvpF family gas vesicle protein [Desulfoluna spongiiphila]|uniref:GvpL/GvpF family gas vesicle protein n=1 Tax=Desulfoluna spongiiphila TaxID=419481 RepID=UPI0012510C22|nr:GvpL/GvpF family gas vesicle protein [Desulfoluna spongiiphila]VVS92311.1 gas vesicle protein gvpl/gvpf [Desulfoluna spongiiphila]
MRQDGKYVYCIIGENDGRNFGATGIGGREDIVSTIGFKDISAVISNTPMTRYVISRENLTHHETVIETVMTEYTILPVRFCTIAESTEEIRTLLRKRYAEFKGLLRDMDNKIEMGVKAYWKEMPEVFQEIDRSDADVMALKKKLGEARGDTQVKGALGKAVEKALAVKKADEGWSLLNRLRRISVEVKAKEPQTDPMVCNLACLIDRTREREFDYVVEELADKYEGRYAFAYVGPAPPFHFVTIEIKA